MEAAEYGYKNAFKADSSGTLMYYMWLPPCGCVRLDGQFEVSSEIEINKAKLVAWSAAIAGAAIAAPLIGDVVVVSAAAALEAVSAAVAAAAL